MIEARRPTLDFLIVVADANVAAAAFWISTVVRDFFGRPENDHWIVTVPSSCDLTESFGVVGGVVGGAAPLGAARPTAPSRVPAAMAKATTRRRYMCVSSRNSG